VYSITRIPFVMSSPRYLTFAAGAFTIITVAPTLAPTLTIVVHGPSRPPSGTLVAHHRDVPQPFHFSLFPSIPSAQEILPLSLPR
jgi:hypothetical protein